MAKKKAAKKAKPRASSRRREPPRWLSAEAKRRWRQVVAEVSPDADLALVEAYCVCFARWRKNEQVIEQLGQTYTKRDRAGAPTEVLPLPFHAMAMRYLAELRQLAKQLGLGRVQKGSAGEAAAVLSPSGRGAGARSLGGQKLTSIEAYKQRMGAPEGM